MGTGGGTGNGFGINLPQDVGSGGGEGRLLRAFVTRAEAAGFDSLWVSESPRPEVLDPLEVLTFAAAVSDRLRLGVAVLLSAFRPPALLARDIATLDRLSHGRSIVGLGLGNDRTRYARAGLTVPRRSVHFEAGVSVLRSLLACERTDSHEPWWDFEDEPRPLTPVQRPSPPIWIGARAPAALARAARVGDGWVGAGSSTPAEFRTALASLREFLDQAGREEATFAVAKRVYVHVLSNGEDASAVWPDLRRWCAHHYGDPEVADRFFVVGSVAECADHLGQLRALGASTLILNPVLDPSRQLARLSAEVVPQAS